MGTSDVMTGVGQAHDDGPAPGPRSRRQEYTDATRQGLVDAATGLFTDHGYASTSIEDIVRVARVTRGALYHHFASKLELFATVCGQIEGRIAATVEDAVRQEPDPTARAAAGLGAFLDACLDPGYQRVVLQQAPAVLLESGPRDPGTEPRMLVLVRRIVTDLVSAGAFPGLPVEIVSRVLFGAMCEAGHYVADGADPQQARAQAQEVMGRVLRGLM